MNGEHITIEALRYPNPERQRSFAVHVFNRHTINVIVTSNPNVVRMWLSYTLRPLLLMKRKRLVFGLGVQWRPSSNSAATLQICGGHRCLIFQLEHAPGVPSALRRFLCHPNNTFVGFWNYDDRNKLINSRHTISVLNLVDIRYVAEQRKGVSKRVSRETLAAFLLGFEGVKRPEWIGRSAWDDYWLSEEQVQYACFDTFLSFAMGMELHVWDRESRRVYTD